MKARPPPHVNFWNANIVTRMSRQSFNPGNRGQNDIIKYCYNHGNDDIAIVHRLLSQYSLLAGEVPPPPPSFSPFWSLFFAIFNEMNVFSETWFIWLNWLQNTIPEHLLHPGTSARVYPVGSWPMATNVLRRYWRVAGLQPVPVTMGRGELGS